MNKLFNNLWNITFLEGLNINEERKQASVLLIDGSLEPRKPEGHVFLRIGSFAVCLVVREEAGASVWTQQSVCTIRTEIAFKESASYSRDHLKESEEKGKRKFHLEETDYS
jgi:hypothetical protein